MDASHDGALAGRASPYAGLSHFTEARADLFFGRDEERTALIGNLRTSRLTVLYAPSGVGKSSLLRAGVQARLHELARQRLQHGEPVDFVPVVFDSWRDAPTSELIGELERAIDPYRTERAAPSLPRESLQTAFQAAVVQTGASCLVMLDQFEEYFLYRHAEGHRTAFVDELAACIAARDLRVNFLVAVREDAYAGLGDLFEGRLTNVYSNYLQLRYLDRKSAQRAIVGPIGRFNETHPADQLEIEPALVAAVLDEVQTGQVTFGTGGAGAALPEDTRADEIETPYLQLVMTTLWERELESGSSTLRLETLRRLGGAASIVRSHMDGVLAGLPDAEQDLAAGIFHHLVTPSGTKIVHRVSDLAAYGGHDRDAVLRLVNDLISRDQRLLRPIPAADGNEDEPRVEIFHDVLAPAIIQWRTAHEERRLRAEKLAAERTAARERRRARTFRALAIVAAAGLVIAIAAFVITEVHRTNAARAASNSRELAAKASVYLGTDQLRPGSLLAVAAHDISPTTESTHSLVAASVRTFAMSSYVRTASGIDQVAMSPDGRSVVVAGENGSAQLVDLRGHRVVQTIHAALGDNVDSAAYAPGGATVALAGDNDHVVVWNLASRRVTCDLRASAIVETVAFDDSGEVLASAGDDGRVQLWDPSGCRRVRSFAEHTAVDSVAFAPDGHTLAVAAGRTVAIVDAATGRLLNRLTATATVYGVAFDPTGRRVAAAQADGHVSLWAADAHTPLDVWSGAPAFEGVAFSKDGTLVAGADDDGTVSIWSARTGARVADLVGHSDHVNSVAFGAGLLTSGGDDGMLTTWSTTAIGSDSGLRAGDRVNGLAFDARGDLLAAASGQRVNLFGVGSDRHLVLPDDGRATVHTVAFAPRGSLLAWSDDHGRTTMYDAARDTVLRHLLQGGAVYSDAFSPDGRLLATGGSSGRVSIWNVRSGGSAGVLNAAGVVDAVAFSPDGRLLAAADQNGEISVWSRPSDRLLRRFASSDAPVQTIAFNARDTLAAGGNDESIVLWDPRTGVPIGDPLAGPVGSMLDLAFDSSDPSRLFSVSQDGAVMDWDLRSGLGVPVQMSAQNPRAIAASPHGTLAVGGADGVITLHRHTPAAVAPQTVAAALCAIVGGDLTRYEWRQNAPTLSYRRECSR